MQAGDTSQGRWRLGHRPALDGLRGVAIALVLVCHAHVPGLRAAGAVGVTMFFTLSGFLITSLLLQEYDASRRVSLRAFYLRRARRLLPALAGCLAVVLCGSVVFGADFARPFGVVVAALYGSSWVAAANLDLGALAHTWSLSVEEQFYLAWPVLLLVAMRLRGRVGVLVAAGVGAGAAVCERFLLWDDGDGRWRIYYGADTRADALLLGCLLAVLVSMGREGRSRPLLAAVGLAATGPLWFASGYAMWMLVPMLVPAATCVMLFSAGRGAGVGWLRIGWLRWLGRRSYGIYLLHYPAVVGLDLLVPGWPWWGRGLVMVVLSLGAAELSWRVLEDRFLRYQETRPHTPERAAGPVAVSAS